MLNLNDKGISKIKEFAENINLIDDDEWHAYSRSIDVNVYLDEDGKKHADVYQVENGNVNTNESIKLF